MLMLHTRMSFTGRLLAFKDLRIVGLHTRECQSQVHCVSIPAISSVSQTEVHPSSAQSTQPASLLNQVQPTGVVPISN